VLGTVALAVAQEIDENDPVTVLRKLVCYRMVVLPRKEKTIYQYQASFAGRASRTALLVADLESVVAEIRHGDRLAA